MTYSKNGNKLGRPRKFQSVEELQEKIDAYFAGCDEKGEAYTISGLALVMDTNRQTLINYQELEEYASFFDTIKKAKLRVESYAENRLYSGQQVAGVIFSLKNNFGWKDKTETEITGPAGGPIAVKFEGVLDEWSK